MRGKIIGIVSGIFAMAGASTASATTIQVAQEAVFGLGDFDSGILGSVSVFDGSGNDAAGNYNRTNSSYGGFAGGPAAVSETSQLFFVASDDGLALFVVHDAVDTTSGLGDTDYTLTGDTGDFLVKDDPTDAFDSYITDGNDFDTENRWSSAFSDGYVFGTLDGFWTITGLTILERGLTDWQVTDAGGNNIALTPGLRVRLQVEPIPVPAAITMMPLALGVAVVMSRRKHQR